MNTLLKLLFIYLCVISLPAAAQTQEYVLKNFTQEEGLPSNETYFVFEDSKHFLWIGTDHGVVRFDGNKFETFKLPDNVVFIVKEDRKGRIWFFTQKAQLAYFENEKIHEFPFNAKISKRIQRIVIVQANFDSSDRIVLSSTLDSNYRISMTGEIEAFNTFVPQVQPSRFLLNRSLLGGFECNRVLSSHPFATGFEIEVNDRGISRTYSIPIYHASGSHFGTLDGKDGNLYFFCGKYVILLKKDGSYQTKEFPNEVLCMKFFEGNILIGTMRKGAFIVKRDLSFSNDALILPGKSISSIDFDFEGGTWLTTLETGIFYMKNTSIKWIKPLKTEDALVNRVLNLGDSALLFTTSTGIYRLKEYGIDTVARLSNSNASDLLVDDKKIVYFFGGVEDHHATMKSMLPAFKQVNFASATGEVVRIDEQRLMLPTSLSIFYWLRFFKNKLSLADRSWVLMKPGKLFRDATGNIWAGANDGLYKFSESRNQFLQQFTNTSLISKGVTCVRQLTSGQLVVAIRFDGVAILNDNGIALHISEKNGLLSNKVKYLLVDKNQLWVATAKGVSIINFESINPYKYTLTNIGKNDGLYNVTINQLIRFKDAIVAPTSNGIFFINQPAKFLQRNSLKIPLYIKKVQYYAGDTAGVNAITVPYGKTSVLLKYVAVSFNGSDQVEYWYRFRDTDSTWIKTTSTELPLENFEPGTYELELKAMIANQGRSSEVVHFTINVSKAWWQHNLLKLVVALATAFATWLYFKKRLKKIKDEERQKTALNAQMAELEQTALRSQMNSHFIFNCLTSIQQLIVSGNKTDASEFLVKFARLIRKTLEISSRSFITAADEADYLSEYLTLEQLRMANQFEFRIDVAPEVNSCKIPNMMLQPAVENCVRHGVKTLEDRKGYIQVSIQPAGALLKCTIADNGVGRETAAGFSRKSFTAHKSYGMEIIQKRLHAIVASGVEKEGQIQIIDLKDAHGHPCGTEVIIFLPIIK